jgi:hypothetical protein
VEQKEKKTLVFFLKLNITFNTIAVLVQPRVALDPGIPTRPSIGTGFRPDRR